jgi:hypothetical protein
MVGVDVPLERAGGSKDGIRVSEQNTDQGIKINQRWRNLQGRPIGTGIRSVHAELAQRQIHHVRCKIAVTVIIKERWMSLTASCIGT